MLDTLAQRDMESFVGNDPRAAYNLISYILEQKIPHRFPPGILSAEQVAPSAQLSSMFDTIWENVTEDYRARGRRFLRDLVRFLLATGWYSVFAVPSEDGSFFAAEVWHPITVYPTWTDILSECAHIFNPGKSAIESMSVRNGWNLQSPPSDSTTVYDYWWVERQTATLSVHNSIIIGNQQVKPDFVETRFTRIPIFIAPCGGLPDTGEMAGDNWKAEIGQSFIATNENVLKTFNKWWTFIRTLAGPVKDVNLLYNRGDIVVSGLFPLYARGIEALGAGKAFIGPGYREAGYPWTCSLDPHSMAEAIVSCWEGYSSIDYRKWAEERHDVAETVRQSIDVYKRYLK